MKFTSVLVAALSVVAPPAALAQQTIDYAASRARFPAAAAAAASGLKKYGAKDFAGALKDFEQAVTADPTDAESLFNIAVIQMETGEAQPAIKSYVRVLKVPEKRLSDDLWVLARNGILAVGIRYLQAGDYRAAVPVFRLLTDSGPEDRVALFNLAVALFRLEQWTELDGVSSRLVALDPLNENALIMAAQAHRGLAAAAGTDSPAGKVSLAKAITALEAVDKAPFYLEVRQFGETDAGVQLEANARWNRPQSQSEKTLHFTFHGRRGVLGTKSIIIGVPKTGVDERFTLTPSVKAAVTSFSYRVE